MAPKRKKRSKSKERQEAKQNTSTATAEAEDAKKDTIASSKSGSVDPFGAFDNGEGVTEEKRLAALEEESRRKAAKVPSPTVVGARR